MWTICYKDPGNHRTWERVSDQTQARQYVQALIGKNVPHEAIIVIPETNMEYDVKSILEG